MATTTRTITAGQNVASTIAQAQQVAENLRASGHTVEVGEPFENVTVRYYGMWSVNLTITDPEVTETTATDPVAATVVWDTNTALAPSLTSAELDAQEAKDAASTADEETEGEPDVTETETVPPTDEPTETEDNVLGNDTAADPVGPEVEATPPTTEPSAPSA